MKYYPNDISWILGTCNKLGCLLECEPNIFRVLFILVGICNPVAGVGLYLSLSFSIWLLIKLGCSKEETPQVSDEFDEFVDKS